MIHLAHRDENVPQMGRDATTFYARPACGQTENAYNYEGEDKAQCVGPDWASEIECGRCRRIHEHWKRLAASGLSPSAETEKGTL